MLVTFDFIVRGQSHHRAFLEIHGFAAFQGACAYLGPFRVEEHATSFVCYLASLLQVIKSLLMVFMGAMTEVQPGDGHTGLQKCDELGHSSGRRAESTNDVRFLRRQVTSWWVHHTSKI